MQGSESTGGAAVGKHHPNEDANGQNRDKTHAERSGTRVGTPRPAHRSSLLHPGEESVEAARACLFDHSDQPQRPKARQRHEVALTLSGSMRTLQPTSSGWKAADTLGRYGT